MCVLCGIMRLGSLYGIEGLCAIWCVCVCVCVYVHVCVCVCVLACNVCANVLVAIFSKLKHSVLKESF